MRSFLGSLTRGKPQLNIQQHSQGVEEITSQICITSRRSVLLSLLGLILQITEIVFHTDIVSPKKNLTSSTPFQSHLLHPQLFQKLPI
jgi:hypothetical protein